MSTVDPSPELEAERKRRIDRAKDQYALGRIELDEFEAQVGEILELPEPHPMAAMLHHGLVTRDELRQFVIQRTLDTEQEERPPADFTVDPMQVAYYKDLIVAHKGTPRRHFTFEEWKAGAR